VIIAIVFSVIYWQLAVTTMFPNKFFVSKLKLFV